MKYFHCFLSILFPIFTLTTLTASEKALPEEMQTIMHQSKYAHSTWGIYVKDLQTGNVTLDLNSDKFLAPASTTKLFSVAALLNAFGDEFRFKTPVYSTGTIEKGTLQGNLILVAQGDLTMGGREPDRNTIAFTKMDHVTANFVPGTILTKEDPLQALNDLAKQVYNKGIRQINGDVLIDDSLFETIQEREVILSPIMINENVVDIIINPTTVGQKADITWRPKLVGYTVENQVTTVGKDGSLRIHMMDDTDQKIIIQGTIPIDLQDIVLTSPIKEPNAFARAAFIQALEQNGIKVTLPKSPQNKSLQSYKNPQVIALWTSPPLSEYAKLILKVSHNTGANLIPLLLASQQGKKTFDEGMRLLGDFLTQKVGISPDEFVIADAAGSNDNRLTPKTEVKLLEYIYKQSPSRFQHFFDSLPILGVDGSLQDFGKTTEAVGKVRAKPGTGVGINSATDRNFLITQALAGYIQGKNGHLYAYSLFVNNAAMPSIMDIFAIFEDESQLSSMIYNHSN